MGLITLLICISRVGWANQALQFELTQEKIETAWMSEIGDGNYAVIVKLNKPHRKDFSQLTASNIDEKLAIVFSGQILTSAVIKGRIDSGIIKVGEWASEEDANEFMQSIVPKFRQNVSEGSKNHTKTKASKRLRAEEYSNLALDSLGNFSLTNDTTFLTNGLELIEKAIEADNQYIVGYYWKATMLTKLKEYEKAISTLNEGIQKNYKDEDDKIVNLFFMRGIVRQKTGNKELAFNDYSKAIEIYRKRLKIDPKNWDATMNISQALILMDKKKEALKFLNETIEKYPEEKTAKKILKAAEDFNIIQYLEHI